MIDNVSFFAGHLLLTVPAEDLILRTPHPVSTANTLPACDQWRELRPHPAGTLLTECALCRDHDTENAPGLGS